MASHHAVQGGTVYEKLSEVPAVPKTPVEVAQVSLVRDYHQGDW